MSNYVTIEKVITPKKTVCHMEAWNGAEFISKSITDSEAWKTEISCANAGYTSKNESEIVGDAIHTKITWTK
jgi:hypothetical protein